MARVAVLAELLQLAGGDAAEDRGRGLVEGRRPLVRRVVRELEGEDVAVVRLRMGGWVGGWGAVRVLGFRTGGFGR